MLYDAFVMGMRSLLHINMVSFFMVFFTRSLTYKDLMKVWLMGWS